MDPLIKNQRISQIQKKTRNLKTKICDIIGGGSISLKDSKYIINQIIDKKTNGFYEKYINKIKKLNYYYSNGSKKIDIKKLDQTFIDAKKNYLRILDNKKKIKSKWNINFKIYKNYEINKNCFIDKKKSRFLKSYNLKNYLLSTKKIPKLECYIEYQLFKSLLSGEFPWKTSLSGSTIMYKRNPNKFNVDMVFSLNFLRV